MALLYMDGFEHQDIRQWQGSANMSFTTGRTAGNAANFQLSGANFNAALNQAPGSSTYYIGLALYLNTFGGQFTFNLRNSGRTATCVYLQFPTGSNTPNVYRGSSSTIIATSSVGLTTLTWYHIGLEVTIGASTSGKLYINQVQTASWSGIDTRNGGDLSTIGGFHFVRGGANGDGGFLDDLYLMDGSGSRNNAWSGDLVVRTLFPNAAGSSTQWTVSPSGANYAAVDETGGAGVDYVYSNVVGNSDLYGLPDLPTTGVYDVKGVQISGVMTSSDGGAVNAATLARANGVTTEGTSILLTPTPGLVYGTFQEASPGVPWTKTLVDGMEAGIRVK